MLDLWGHALDHRGYSRTRQKVAPRAWRLSQRRILVREQTMMILHHGWRSSASRRVRLCLEEKGLAYEGHVVDMAKMEHHSLEYLKINPLGVIPTLIHDGKPLHESGTICEYLDESFPDPPLRPNDPYERAQMRNWIRHIDALIGNLIIFNWRHHLQKTAQQWSDAELAERLKHIPSKERQEAWLRVARKPYTEEERDAARGKLVQFLDKMEEALAPSGWLVGGLIRSPISPRCRSSSGSTRRLRRISYPKRTIPASPNGGLRYRRARHSRERISVRS
jgi:glutathione S-transferase